MNACKWNSLFIFLVLYLIIIIIFILFYLVCRKHTASGMVYFNDINDLKRLEEALIAKRKSDQATSGKDESHESTQNKKKLKT